MQREAVGCGERRLELLLFSEVVEQGSRARSSRDIVGGAATKG